MTLEARKKMRAGSEATAAGIHRASQGRSLLSTTASPPANPTVKRQQRMLANDPTPVTSQKHQVHTSRRVEERERSLSRHETGEATKRLRSAYGLAPCLWRTRKALDPAKAAHHPAPSHPYSRLAASTSTSTAAVPNRTDGSRRLKADSPKACRQTRRNMKYSGWKRSPCAVLTRSENMAANPA